MSRYVSATASTPPSARGASGEAACSHFIAMIERRTPIVYRRRHEFVTDNLPHDCEILALPLAGDGRTIDMLMSGFVWNE
jgi:hypothetical protein